MKTGNGGEQSDSVHLRIDVDDDELRVLRVVTQNAE